MCAAKCEVNTMVGLTACDNMTITLECTFNFVEHKN